jgi:hypothetical protein
VNLKKIIPPEETDEQQPKDIVISKAICSENTYHIYRDNGVEVTITSNQGLLKSSPNLRIEEINFLREFYPDLIKTI